MHARKWGVNVRLEVHVCKHFMTAHKSKPLLTTRSQTLTIDVPLDAVKSILAFDQFKRIMPYVGMPLSAIGIAFSDGNNVGSVRTFTSKATGVSNSAHGVPSHAIGCLRAHVSV